MRRRFRIDGLKVSRGERHYLIGLGATLALFSAGYVSYQLWLNYSADMQRAMAWLRGAQDLGTEKLQIPILRQASFPRIAVQQRSMAIAVDQAVSALKLAELPAQGESLEIQFAGIDLASNSEMANYLLLAVKQELQKAGAARVVIAYPKTTFKLGSTATPDGYADELDSVLMAKRDTELVNRERQDEANWRQVLLRVREAGVDTEDRSIYSQDFYMRVALWACGLIFAVGAISFVMLNRRWPGRGGRSAAMATALALAVGWNVVMTMFIVLRPNQKRYNVINRVDLNAFVMLKTGPYQANGQGRHQVLLGVDRFNQPAVLGAPKVMAPGEGGVVQIIPAPTPAPVP